MHSYEEARSLYDEKFHMNLNLKTSRSILENLTSLLLTHSSHFFFQASTKRHSSQFVLVRVARESSLHTHTRRQTMYHRYHQHAGRKNAVGANVSRGGSGVDYLTSAINKINLHGSPQSRVSDEYEQTQLQKELDEMFEKQAREKLTNVPDYKMPSQFRQGLNLFDHQVEGIRWLIHRERSGGAEGLFAETHRANGEKAWRCKISDKLQTQPPKRAKGAILADGKYCNCALLRLETHTLC